MKFSYYLGGGLLFLLCVATSTTTESNDHSPSFPDPTAMVDTDTIPQPTRVPTREAVPNTRERVPDTRLQLNRVPGREVTSTRFPAITASATKMNILYIGVDNPIELTGVNEDEENISVVFEKGNVRKVSSSKYIITTGTIGEAKLTIRRGNLPPVVSTFLVKRVPNPVAMVSNSQGGSMGSGEFKAQGGVLAQLNDFDFAAQCNVMSFELTYLARRQDGITIQNAGARYNAQARNIINRAKPGDIYYFTNVRAKCSGDVNSRLINSLVFKIR